MSKSHGNRRSPFVTMNQVRSCGEQAAFWLLPKMQRRLSTNWKFSTNLQVLQWHGQWKGVQIVVATLLSFASFSLRDSTVQGATLAYGDDPPCKDLRAFARISCEQLLMIWAMMFPFQFDGYSVFDCTSWIGLQQKLQIHSEITDSLRNSFLCEQSV